MTDRTRSEVRSDTFGGESPASSRTARANRILVVDDEEAIRTIIVSMLVAAHYECREANSGLEALALLKSGEQFDLLLADVMMPEMDGIALLERTKSKYPDMPVVIMSGERDISVALSAIRNGAFDYLVKPFEREQLLDVAGRAMENRRLKLEHRAYVSSLEAQVATLSKQLRSKKSSRRSR